MMIFYILLLADLHFNDVSADSNVFITTDENPCECGRNVTLTCRLKEFTFAVEWLNENSKRPISKCIKDQLCNLNPDYVGQYIYTFNESLCVFNLTIRNVNKNDNGRKLLCSDGSASDYYTLKVRDYEPHLFEDPKDRSITAESGCLSKGTNMSFIWTKIDASSKKETEFEPKKRKKKITHCSNDYECGRNEQIKHVETISAQRSGVGKYYLKVKAVYGNERIESVCTEVQYTSFEEEDDLSNVDANVHDVGFAAIVVVVAVKVAIIAVILNRSFLSKSIADVITKFRGRTVTQTEYETIHLRTETVLDINCENETGQGNGTDANIPAVTEEMVPTVGGNRGDSTDNWTGTHQGEPEANIAQEGEVRNQTVGEDISDILENETGQGNGTDANIPAVTEEMAPTVGGNRGDSTDNGTGTHQEEPEAKIAEEGQVRNQTFGGNISDGKGAHYQNGMKYI